MKFDPARDVPDLDGKVAIVTGSTSGIGFAAAQILVRKGAKVYLAARNEEKAKACLKRIRVEDEGHEKGQAEWLYLDLADPELAKKSAEEFLRKEQRLDILIRVVPGRLLKVNNAAMIIAEYKMGSRGIQEICTINHFSPFVFTNTLLPLLESTANLPGSDVRIVNVASDAHAYVAPTQFRKKEDFNMSYQKEWLSSMKRYGSLIQTNITCISVHPGPVLTENSINTARSLPVLIRPIAIAWANLWMYAPLQGAGTPIIAAVTLEALKNPEKYKGAFMVPMGKVNKPSKTAQNTDLARELWTTTETLLKEMGI